MQRAWAEFVVQPTVETCTCEGARCVWCVCRVGDREVSSGRGKNVRWELCGRTREFLGHVRARVMVLFKSCPRGHVQRVYGTATGARLKVPWATPGPRF